MFLEGKPFRWCITYPELDLHRGIKPTVGKVTTRFCTRPRGERVLEKFGRQLDDVVEGFAPLIPRLLLGRDLRQRHAGLRGQPLDRLGEAEPFGHHHEVEDRAIFAGGKIKPRHFLVVDEERRRLLLVKRGKSFPLAPCLFEPHPPAYDFRNRKPRPQLVEELRRKAHEIGRVIRWISQYRAVRHARSPAGDCPGYPQGALEQRPKRISPSLTSSRRGGQASWQPKAQTFVEGASVQEVGERDVLRYQPRGVDENSLVIAFATLLRARNQFVNLGI